MPGFVQIIEFQTSRADEIKALADEFSDQRGAGTVGRITITSDRERPGYHMTIAEFESYESAMENSNRAETTEFSRRMAELCDGPPTFYNLDVLDQWTP